MINLSSNKTFYLRRYWISKIYNVSVNLHYMIMGKSKDFYA